MKNLTEQQHKNKIRELIFDNKKIEAIKYIRNLTGLGLKESKDLYDTFCYDLSKLDDYKFEIKDEETETLITEEDEFFTVDLDIEDESYIEFVATDEPDSGTETDSIENILIQKEEPVGKKSTRKKKSQAFTFEKITKRDKKKKITRSNSGCMLMLTFMFFTGLLIAGVVYFF